MAPIFDLSGADRGINHARKHRVVARGSATRGPRHGASIPRPGWIVSRHPVGRPRPTKDAPAGLGPLRPAKIGCDAFSNGSFPRNRAHDSPTTLAQDRPSAAPRNRGGERPFSLCDPSQRWDGCRSVCRHLLDRGRSPGGRRPRASTTEPRGKADCFEAATGIAAIRPLGFGEPIPDALCRSACSRRCREAICSA